MHEGKYKEASRELQQLIRKNPSDIEARQRLLKLTRLTGDQELHRQQGQDFISYLIAENKMGPAVKVYQEGSEFDKSFKPAKAVERMDMARYLRQSNQGKLAMAVLNNLHSDFPTFDGVPDAYLIVAQLLAEKFNDDQRAIQVLEFILNNYPSHSRISEVEEYLRIIRASTH